MKGKKIMENVKMIKEIERAARHARE